MVMSREGVSLLGVVGACSVGSLKCKKFRERSGFEVIIVLRFLSPTSKLCYQLSVQLSAVDRAKP